MLMKAEYVLIADLGKKKKDEARGSGELKKAAARKNSGHLGFDKS